MSHVDDQSACLALTHDDLRWIETIRAVLRARRTLGSRHCESGGMPFTGGVRVAFGLRKVTTIPMPTTMQSLP